MAVTIAAVLPATTAQAAATQVLRISSLDNTSAVTGYPTGWPSADSVFLGSAYEGFTARSFLSWDASALQNKRIESATAHFHNPYSTSCAATPWEIWTTGAFTAGTSWDVQPAWQHLETTATATSCSDTAVTADVTSFVKRAAQEKVSTPTMGLRAVDEADFSQYKQFWSRYYTDAAKAPYIDVTYSVGVSVTDPSLDEGSSCSTGANRPAIDNVTPGLNVTVDDPSGTPVRADFELTKLDGTALLTAASANQASGTVASVTVPAGKLADGGSYRWRTRGVSANGQGPWTSWCEFAVNKGVVIIDADELNEPVPDELRDALGTYDQLAEGNPEDFGYPDVEGGAIVVDVVTDEAAEKAEALSNGTLQTTPTTGEPEENKAEESAVEGQSNVAGVDMATNTVALSRAETEVLREQVQNAVDNTPAIAAADVWKTDVDRETGRVAITMGDVTSPAAQALEDLFGDRVELITEANPQVTAQVGRLADNLPYYGGARVRTANSHCTTAFAWNISTTQQGLLTAGHCYPTGGYVYTNQGQAIGSIVNNNTRENYTNGTVKLQGQSVYRGDMAVVPATSGTAARIYRGNASSTTSAPVKSMWHRRSQAGDKFCTGGSFSGEICGWTVKSAGGNVKSSGYWTRGIVMSKNKTGWCTRGGDSGGPVYTVNSDGSVAAKGINDGGGGGGKDYYAGALDQCHSFFTDIWDAYYGFPGRLKTS
ncbi:hypothetical protein ACQP2E_10255 [Actinoplanes sp. CA-015351]|uniref:hypothetical protein n=1 Tax=Actinoplanes sp. CA-015351 TaxID=3239897 RepID=UPI003D985A32